MSIKYSLIVVGLLSIIYVGVQLRAVRQRIAIGTALAKAAQPFSFDSPTSTKRFLVIGDSTAVGTGVANPETSIAGRLHQEYPGATIINLAVNGAKLADIQKQLARSQGSFDFILIQGGANNILRLDSLKQSDETLKSLLIDAKKRSSAVALITCGNLGLAPFFPWPANWYYTIRSHTFLNSFQITAKEYGVAFVDLYVSRREDLLSTDPRRFYATDSLHLSADGYGWWYTRLKETLVAAGMTL